MNALRGSAFALLASVWIASAQEYPTKPVRVVLPFAPGGGTDVNARQLTDRLSKSWKQPVIVENPGVGAAMSRQHRSFPDPRMAIHCSSRRCPEEVVASHHSERGSQAELNTIGGVSLSRPLRTQELADTGVNCVVNVNDGRRARVPGALAMYEAVLSRQAHFLDPGSGPARLDYVF